MANDSRAPAALRAGLLLALVSAASFGLSGALARGLIDVGWSPGAVVLARIALAALVVAPLAVRALRGRWGVLRRNTRTVLLYGAIPVAGTQFAYFSAVAAMDVGPALLIEYTAPAAIVVWLWLRRGERPRALTLAGAGVAAIGLVLVLDLLSGADLALDGVLWALAAMLGAATYFVMSADTRSGVPPLALAGGGLAVGSVGLAALGLVGVLPMRATIAAPTYAGEAVPWWLPFIGLGVVTAAVAYVARGRRGSHVRLAAARPAAGHAAARRRRVHRGRRDRRQARRAPTAHEHRCRWRGCAYACGVSAAPRTCSSVK